MSQSLYDIIIAINRTAYSLAMLHAIIMHGSQVMLVI